MDEKDKLDLLKTEMLLDQQQMDKYDGLSSTIKGWVVAMWAASVGWSFQVDNDELLLLSILIVLLFWFFDGMNKNFRHDYKRRRNTIGSALNFYYKKGVLQQEVSAPEFPEHTWFGSLKRFFLPHLSLPYIILILVSLLLMVQ